MGTRVLQRRDYMNFVRNFATFDDGASKLRVEIMVKKIRTMLTTLNEIWVIGSEFFLGGGLDTLVVPIRL